MTLNAPATLTRDFLTVLSGIDEFLMARLIRAQTADGVTIIEFLDDVMQDRTDGFKTHHRIAAAKELIVHIVRDEQPSHTPSPSTRETDRRGSQTPSPSTGEGWGEGDSPAVGADPRVRPLPGSQTPVTPSKAGTQGGGGARNTPANPAHPEPSSTVVPSEKPAPYSIPRREPRGAAGPVTPQPTPLTLSPAQPSFPRKACPVLDTERREPRGAAGAATPQPTPLTLSPPKDDRTTKLDGPAHDAPEHKDAGTEPPGPPPSERGPSA